MGAALARPKRANAGSKMSKLISEATEEDAAEDDEFYKTTYGGFNDVDGDEEYELEEAEEDEVDSDFSDSEESDKGESGGEEEDKKKRKKKVKVKLSNKLKP